MSGGGAPATAQEAAGPRVAGTVSAAAARDHGFGGGAGRQEGSRWWWSRWRERGEWGVPGLAVGRLLDLPIREVAEGGPVVMAWARE